MLRILILFALVALCAIAAALLADYPGALTVQWGSWEIRTSFSLTLVALIILAILLLALHRLYLGLRRTPGRFAIGWAGRQRRKGLDALSKGLVAAATGDGALALRYSTQAEKLLDHKPLTQLLSAQAAQLTGDDNAATRHFNAMLEHKDTEALGLQGLLLHAASQGNVEDALKHAARAFEKNPKARGAYQTLFDLQTNKGDWQTAIDTLDKGRKAGLATQEQARRQKAVLLCAIASSKDVEVKQAESAAQKAYKLNPAFTPAAILAARIHQSKDQMWKASGLLEEAWRAAPHPALVNAYIALKPDESAHERAKRVSGLAQMRPDHMESQLLLARQAVNTRDWESARNALSDLATSTPTARVCALMAEIERGEGNVGAAREWMARAVTAPPEADWIRASFEFSQADWADLIRQVGDAEDIWPPTPDPAVFARAQVVAPFTQELQVEAEELTPVKTTVKSTPKSTAKTITTAPPKIRSEKPGTKRKVQPDNAPLRSTRPAQSPPTKSSRISLGGTATLKSRKSAPQYQGGTLAHQPDDPGPDPETT